MTKKQKQDSLDQYLHIECSISHPLLYNSPEKFLTNHGFIQVERTHESNERPYYTKRIAGEPIFVRPSEMSPKEFLRCVEVTGYSRSHRKMNMLGLRESIKAFLVEDCELKEQDIDISGIF